MTLFSQKKWFVKLTHWEFWPFSIVYFPVYFYYFFLAVKAKSFFFFTASNPSIEYGGMLGESKDEIYKLIPEKYIPKTKKFTTQNTIQDIDLYIQTNNITYPFILKPNRGERGRMVKKIETKIELENYLSLIQEDFLLQEYIHYPLELAIFYYRYPEESKGKVTSITRKQLLEVTGDGKSSIKELMEKNIRYQLYTEHIANQYPQRADYIPQKNEKILVEPIGNHCRGTLFLNDSHRINDALEFVMHTMSMEIKDFYFGRFDIRCKSYEALEKGDFKVIELNGAGAEPAHIYHPGRSLFSGYRDICYHLHILCEISIRNHKRGVAYPSFLEGVAYIKKINNQNKKLT
ncbi:MAG: hypothetical protein QM536_09685 [Chitinophagaceae bacterium]|nr:hypothetical protein [Chitinophagaceae bacterium]